MTAADRPAFAELLALLGEAFREPISQARSVAYWLALEDLPLRDAPGGGPRGAEDVQVFPAARRASPARRLCAGRARRVNQQLSKGRRPVEPFVRLFVERLGGWRSVEDCLPLVRLPPIERLYPGIFAAALARGIEIPTEAQARDRVALPAPAARPLLPERGRPA